MNIRKIVFLAEGQLGDLLLLTPALRGVKESFPSSNVSVLVLERRSADESKPDAFSDLAASLSERESSVLATNPHVDDLFVLNRQALRSLHGMARLKAEWQIVSFLRRQKFDAVVCTFPEDRFAEWAFASGARVRVGQEKQSLRWLLTHTPDIEKAEIGVLEYYCTLVEQLGATINSRQTEYQIPEVSRIWAGTSSRDRIAIHPGATGNYKIWMPDRFAALIDHLSKKYDIVLLKSKMDEPIVSEIKHHLHAIVLEVETDRNVGNFAAMLKQCKACISNDSGPRHLAVACGVLSIALFRHHYELEWGVYPADRAVIVQGMDACPVCPAGECMNKIPESNIFGSYCMRMITVEQVIAALELLTPG